MDIAKAFLIVGFTVGVFIGAFLYGLALAVWTAWWLVPGWDWFVVPLGLPPISLWTFVGLRMLIFFRQAEWPKEPAEARKVPNWEKALRVTATFVAPMLGYLVMKWIAGRA